MADKKNSNNKNSKNAKKKKTDKLHGGLDLLGIAPGPVGPIADGVNAVIYLAEGDAKNAAASAFAAIPGIGDFSKAAKTVDKTVDVVKGVQKIDKAKDAAKIISKTGKNAAKAADTAKDAAKAVDAARNTVKVSKNVKKSLKSIKLPKRVEKKVKAALKIKSANKGKMKTGAKKSQSRNNRKKTVKNKKNKDKKQQLKGKCFSGDMLVLTGSGYRLIQEIRKGDDIYARNAQTGMIGLRKVAEVFQNEAHTIHHIWLDGKEELKMTAYHPVYVKDRGWVKAIHLRQGDYLETMDGTSQVTKVEKTRHEEPVAVYNFHVEDWESYFVSEKRVYVHNGEGNCGREKPDSKTNNRKTVNGFKAEVNAGQQNKHIPGTNEYKNAVNNGQTKSIMYGDKNDIQNLLDKKAGTGKFIGDNKERVDFGQVIGEYVDPGTGNKERTTIGIIHYGKRGAHIVPARPK